MKALLRRTGRLLNAEDGPTAVEYALMLALIALVLMSVVRGLGSSVGSTINRTNTNAFSGS